MFGFEDQHDNIYNEKSDKASWTHEAIAGAAAFEAMKKYEASHPGDKHKLTKEALAGLAGVEVDKLFETKGLDFLDRQRAKSEAENCSEQLLAQQQ